VAPGGAIESLPQPDVQVVLVGRDQRLDLLSDQLVLGVPEHLGQACADHQHPARGVDDQVAAVHRLQEVSDVSGVRPLRAVDHDGQQRVVGEPEQLAHDAHRDLLPVVADRPEVHADRPASGLRHQPPVDPVVVLEEPVGHEAPRRPPEHLVAGAAEQLLERLVDQHHLAVDAHQQPRLVGLVEDLLDRRPDARAQRLAEVVLPRRRHTRSVIAAKPAREPPG